MQDTLILIGIGATQIFLLWYGVHVSVPDHRTRNAFVIILVGVIGLVLTVWGGVRSGAWQTLLTGKLEKIEQNTEHPTPVNVTVPPPIVNIPAVSKHTSVEYLDPKDAFIATQVSSIFPMAVGQKPIVPFAFRNAGDYTVQHPKATGVVVLLPGDDPEGSFKSTYRALKFTGASGSIVRGSPVYSYNTYMGPELTTDIMEKMRTGKLDLCNVGGVRWADETGNYETTVFQCLIVNDPVKGEFNWHVFSENNEEHRLPFGVN